MDQAGISANIRKIAERLVVYETTSETSEAIGLAAAQVCEKLASLLGKLIGKDGSRALLARALTLAKRDTDALAPVTFTADGSLEGLTGNAAEASPVLVAHLVGLVVTFMGETLTLRTLHKVWPDQLTSDIYLDERNVNGSTQ